MARWLRWERIAPAGVMVLMLALAACGATPSEAGGDVGATTGWQHYAGAHFSLFYPPDWQQKSVALQTNGAATTGTTFLFYSPDGKQELAVAELDGLTSDAVHNVCGSVGTKATIAGLPMIYKLAASGVRNYTFVSANNISYTLISEGPSKQPDNQARYNTMMNTFQPDARTSACT